MNKDELLKLIALGEGYNLEFKENFTDSLDKEMCAFANSVGGRILLGVNDKGAIVGVNPTNRLKSQIQNISRNLDPKLGVVIEAVENVLIITVPEGNNKPYSISGKFYERQGTNTQQLTRDEIREFFKKEGLLLFDEKINQKFDIEKDIDDKAFETFLKKSKITPPKDRIDLFRNLSLIEEHKMKNAGVLLFANNVTRFITNAQIICVLFQGKSKYKILDSAEFDSDLYSSYENAITYIKSKLNKEFIIKGGPHEEHLELPEDAIREALLNAIAHRNYFSNAIISVYIYSDRIEFVNAGGLVKGLKISELGKISLPRNLLLFGLMHRMDLIEKAGSGIRRMRDAMKEYKLEGPKIEADEDWFTVAFNRPDLQKASLEDRLKEGVTVKVTVKVTENQRKITEEITKNQYITAAELSKIILISERKIKENLSKLKQKNIIERIGPDKGGYWKVKK